MCRYSLYFLLCRNSRQLSRQYFRERLNWTVAQNSLKERYLSQFNCFKSSLIVIFKDRSPFTIYALSVYTASYGRKLMNSVLSISLLSINSVICNPLGFSYYYSTCFFFFPPINSLIITPPIQIIWGDGLSLLKIMIEFVAFAD